MIRLFLTTLFLFLSFVSTHASGTVWQIGTQDRSAAEFALGPKDFRQFLANDFGYEDKYFVVGKSDIKHDFPYVLPGPTNTWGGTWSTAGWRTHQINILFDLTAAPTDGTQWTLVVSLLDYAKKFLPLVKVSVNYQHEKIQLTAEGYDINRQANPKYREPIVDTLSITGDLTIATPKRIEIPISGDVLKKGGNRVTITVLEGSWILFDDIRLEGDEKVRVSAPNELFVRGVSAAQYELTDGKKRIQPLIVDTEHLSGTPDLSVELDGKTIFNQQLEQGRYVLEVPMPAVNKRKNSSYRILENGVEIAAGVIVRQPQELRTKADYVDTRIGSGHSRWMIAPGPWMPFGMVKLSPDNQNPNWQAGYQPSFETIGCFSHIHEWTLGALGVMPTNGALKTNVGDERKPDQGYRSRIDKSTEQAPIGYYKVDLTDYGIVAEITATTRCGFSRFTFPKDRDGARVLLDLHPPTEKDFNLVDIKIRKVNDYRIEGYSHQLSPQVWSDDACQDYTVHFVVEFDKPIKSIGNWVEKKISYSDSLVVGKCRNAGLFVEFDQTKYPVVQVRTGISLVSVENAAQNLREEVEQPFGWDFNAVRRNQVDVWNDIFDRIDITTSNAVEKRRFYNNMYRSVCSRNIFSDVNGEWVSTDGKTRKVTNPADVMLGCDAFWNTFWNLNQFWNLVTPEWSSRWVKSQLSMYDANGWLSKGPAGLNYIPVMVAEHEIPMMVGAYQMGVRDYDVEKMFESVKKMETTPGIKLFNGFAGNRDLVPFIKHKYVPSDLGRFSNTMEYAFDNWTVGQLAKALGKADDYKLFDERGGWWRNAMDDQGYCHMRLSNGDWVTDFDPFTTGANKHYVEGNAWQLSFFVPQDVQGLVDVIGRERFVERLDWGFSQSEPWRYNAPNDQYWDYPVVQGNQQSMHFAFLFNWAGKPWLTQKWSRSILDRYYGSGDSNAYLGDEDQGQMSAWAVMASLGLFQTDGGTRIDPVYEITSPLFEKTVIDLGGRYGRGKSFVIEAKGASANNIYIQKATLNGEELKSFAFPASELLKGGCLTLEMGDKPNMEWGVDPNLP